MTFYEAVGRVTVYIAICISICLIFYEIVDVLFSLVFAAVERRFKKDADTQDDFNIKSPEELAFEKRTLERQAHIEESIEEYSCYDCELWEKGSPDGTCKHYLDRTCPFGYYSIKS